MNIVNSLAEFEQKLAVEKCSGLVRLYPEDEKQARTVWAEAQKIHDIFPAVPIFLVKGGLGEPEAEEACGALLKKHGQADSFLLLPLWWIVWKGKVRAVYKQSGMIARDLLSMFGGKDPVESIGAWVEKTMGVERGTGNFKAREGQPQAPRQPRKSNPDEPTPTRLQAPHTVLGVAIDADPDTVRAAYRKLCAKYHPDKYAMESPAKQAAATRRMTEINAAYEVMKKK